MGPGVAVTVTVVVAMQPVGGVKIMGAVPAVRPLTTPAAVMVATMVALLLHEPVVPVDNVVVAPVHIPLVPVIVGAVFTVMFFVAEQLPTV
jgi:hypothetical protein